MEKVVNFILYTKHQENGRETTNLMTAEIKKTGGLKIKK
jgi:hypothetical protein